MINKLNSESGVSNPYSGTLNYNQIDLSPVDHAEGLVPKEIQEYKDRMREFREQLRIKTKKENTESLKDRLAKIDIGNINDKNKINLQYLVNDASKIRQFATYNDYDMRSIDFTALDTAVKAANARLEKMRNGEQNTNVDIDLDNNAYSSTTKRSILG